MAETPYEVVPFDEPRLTQCFVGASHNKLPLEGDEKRHLKYFFRYLTDLSVKTLVVEHNYVDRDFLDDHAAYYVRCFREYSRTCTRLHCFTNEFSTDDFRKCLQGVDGLTTQQLQAAYQGFIVVKPLPHTVVGKTCLSVYTNNGTRSFPAATSVDANLFGIPLTIRETLPFQEQDGVVAACATSALWSVFYATAERFQHQLLTPVAITKTATHLLPAKNRVIPNHGLSMHEMAHAIRSIGLEPMVAEVSELDRLRLILYAYLRARIPVILGVDLYDEIATGQYVPLGKHAIAISGYNLGGQLQSIGGSLRVTASRIDKIYGHDDQIGPFARMEFSGSVTLKGGAVEALTTSWPSHGGDAGRVYAVPFMLLCPMYHKVRIEWKWVTLAVTDLDLFLADIRPFLGLDTTTLEWDLRLTTVQETKNDFRIRGDLTAEQRHQLLTQAMPRFLWRATAKLDNHDILDVLYDATDIETGEVLMAAISYDAELRTFMGEMANDEAFGTASLKRATRNFIVKVANT